MKIAYQRVIVERFMKGKELEAFNELYEEAKMNRGRKLITKLDLKIAADWKNGMTGRELSQKYKLSQTRIESRVRAVAKRAFLDS